jgi:transposase-like protein
MGDPATLMEFMDRYQTEDDCRQALFAHRWPDGFSCPRCSHHRAYPLRTRLLYECAACGYQASLIAGTILQGTRVDLRKWLLAIYLLATTKKTLSSAELGRQLALAPQTAWTIRHKIMHAMARRGQEPLLFGLVEMDESYVGGAKPGRRGRGAQGKTPVAVMAERTPEGGLSLAHMRVVDTVGGQSLAHAAAGSVLPGSIIVTDGLASYRRLSTIGYVHESHVQESPRDAIAILPWVHVVISNFKRWILDVFHGVSPKHLQSYLDEFCYRLNRRHARADLFRRVLNRCIRYTGPVTYAQLTAS